MTQILDVRNAMLDRMEHMKSASGAGAVREALDGPQRKGVVTAFEEVLRAVDAEQHRAGHLLAEVDSGRSKDLVGAMIQSQKASLSFSALLQVRNKVSTAFDEIMRMPV